MRKKKLKNLEEEQQRQLRDREEEKIEILQRKTVKDLIAPAGIDASNIDHMEIISNAKRYARSFFVSTLPRMCSFPDIFRDMYLFGDINTSIYINPIPEARSQNELNRVINELETERIVAADRGNINRESSLTQKRLEAEELIHGGFLQAYRGWEEQAEGKPQWKEKPCPMMLFQGDADNIVPFGEVTVGDKGLYGSRFIASQLKKMGIPYWFYTKRGAGHELAGTPMVYEKEEIDFFIRRFIIDGKKICTETEEPWKTGYKTDFTIEDYIRANMQ